MPNPYGLTDEQIARLWEILLDPSTELTNEDLLLMEKINECRLERR